MRNETVTVRFYKANALVGLLIACDCIGNGRSNKVWSGKVEGSDVDLPNLKAVQAFSKKRGLVLEKSQDDTPISALANL